MVNGLGGDPGFFLLFPYLLRLFFIVFVILFIIGLSTFLSLLQKSSKKDLAKPTCAWFCALLSFVAFQRFTWDLFTLDWLVVDFLYIQKV